MCVSLSRRSFWVCCHGVRELRGSRTERTLRSFGVLLPALGTVQRKVGLDRWWSLIVLKRWQCRRLKVWVALYRHIPKSEPRLQTKPVSILLPHWSRRTTYHCLLWAIFGIPEDGDLDKTDPILLMPNKLHSPNFYLPTLLFRWIPSTLFSSFFVLNSNFNPVTHPRPSQICGYWKF